MRTLFALLVLAALVTVSRGLLRSEALAGHDTAAYYATQSGFHENIRAGAWWPRWQGDSRFGYGDAKLQHRPPLSHFLAEPFIFLTGRRILGTHLAVVCLVALAGLGMWALTRRALGYSAAAVATTAYLTANYFLSNLYLRGAWYEVAAYAAMPWVLWANEGLCGARVGATRCVRFAVGALAWGGLICGHPQVAAVFLPVAASQVALRSFASRRVWRGLGWGAGVFVVGLLLSAPYWLVFRLEMPYVRMQLYDLGLQCYARHFLDFSSLFRETWPDVYRTYTGAADYLGRPIHVEMRALNGWVWAALAAAPCFWLSRRKGESRGVSLFLAWWVLATVAFALPLSWGVWQRVRSLQYFNFPWRSLNVTSVCIALLAGVVLREAFARLRTNRPTRMVVTVAIVAWMILVAWPHTRGWPDSAHGTEWGLAPEQLRLRDGIPQHLHTPRWVSDYPVAPPESDVEIVEGRGTVTDLRRNPVEWRVRFSAETPVLLRFNHHYYPGWQLQVDAQPFVDAQPSPRGLMVFRLPSGEHSVVLRFASTPLRRFAGALGWVGFAIVVWVSGFCAWRSRMRRANA